MIRTAIISLSVFCCVLGLHGANDEPISFALLPNMLNQQHKFFSLFEISSTKQEIQKICWRAIKLEEHIWFFKAGLYNEFRYKERDFDSSGHKQTDRIILQKYQNVASNDAGNEQFELCKNAAPRTIFQLSSQQEKVFSEACSLLGSNVNIADNPKMAEIVKQFLPESSAGNPPSVKSVNEKPTSCPSLLSVQTVPSSPSENSPVDGNKFNELITAVRARPKLVAAGIALLLAAVGITTKTWHDTREAYDKKMGTAGAFALLPFGTKVTLCVEHMKHRCFGQPEVPKKGDEKTAPPSSSLGMLAAQQKR